MSKRLTFPDRITKVTLSLSSPKDILERSCGEVTRPDTINHRTYKPEPNGLFCERIFGPTEDWQCFCKKYKGIKYASINCDRCGVLIGRKLVRKERMGHIELPEPIVNPIFYLYWPNKVGYLLGITGKKLNGIIDYISYVVIQPGIASAGGVEKMDLLTEREYSTLLDELPASNQALPDKDSKKFIAMTGGVAIEYLLINIDLEKRAKELKEQANNDTSQQRRSEAAKYLEVVEAFRKSNGKNRPEWMTMRYIPVIPAELRPIVQLEKRFAISDLSDLYRRLVISKNRLEKLLQMNAPDIILRNEKRKLQEMANACFINSRHSNSVTTESGRPLKSLSDDLKGKKGLMRGNLLGKRVDFSGRSVIIPNAKLNLYECGLPKDMAVELFKPFIINALIQRGIIDIVRDAGRIIANRDPVIWDILEKILQGHPVLLNRAPTLHRLGIQAFQPKLIEGKSLQINPLVCSGFNADFDGDTMAIHVPLTEMAKAECMMLMLSSNNILNPANGTPIITPSKDITLGLYYLTKIRKSTPKNTIPGEGNNFYSEEEVIVAYNNKQIDIHTKIYVRMNTMSKKEKSTKWKMVETSVGRVIFNKHVPKSIGFVNELLVNKKIQKIVARVYEEEGAEYTARFIDEIKSLGFEYAHKGGLTISMKDLQTPKEKLELVAQGEKEVEEAWNNYSMGLITNKERYNQVVDSWFSISKKVKEHLINWLSDDKGGFNSIHMMKESGASGSAEQITQISGMRGPMSRLQKKGANYEGDTLESPIKSNLLEGLSVEEYFNSSHGARKGLTDTALRTADAGYMGRKLTEVAQSVYICSEDCGSVRGKEMFALYEYKVIVESLSDQIIGRVSLLDVEHPVTKKLIFKKGDLITKEMGRQVEDAGIESVWIRSVLYCDEERGACATCYGISLANKKLVEKGEAVGIIAAQSIAEPGTQLTMRTFHGGGIAAGSASESNIRATNSGVVKLSFVDFISIKDSLGARNIVIGKVGELSIMDTESDKELETHHIPYGSYITCKEGQLIKKGEEICNWDPYSVPILSTTSGKVSFDSIDLGVTYKEKYDEQTGYKEKIIVDSRDKNKNPRVIVTDSDGNNTSYNLPLKASLLVEDGQEIEQGYILAKMARHEIRSGDITTGGLPRVSELLEVRNPANAAIITAIDGIVEYRSIKRGSQELVVKGKNATEIEYKIPLSKHILVQDGDFVKAGSPLSDGVIAIMDIVLIHGVKKALDYILSEIKSIYRSQGVIINSKHIEIILREMSNKVEIVSSGDSDLVPQISIAQNRFKRINTKLLKKRVIINPGDSSFSEGQLVSKLMLLDEKEKLKKAGKKAFTSREAVTAVATPRVEGITRSTMKKDSFIAAASFQESTKVLSNAAIAGKVDHLNGIKENVIMGQLIPVGTGSKILQDIEVKVKK